LKTFRILRKGNKTATMAQQLSEVMNVCKTGKAAKVAKSSIFTLLQSMPLLLGSSQQLEIEIMHVVKSLMYTDGITMTKPGSLKFLMFGPEPSDQSMSIKMGVIGEFIVKRIVLASPTLVLLKCGVQCINESTGEQKDLDIIWIDEAKKTIYYREAKSNIEMDTEKVKATIEKIKDIEETFIKPKYSGYTIDIGVFNWSIWNRDSLTSGISHIKKFEGNGIKVEHLGDMMQLLGFEWSEDAFTSLFRRVGTLLRTIDSTD